MALQSTASLPAPSPAAPVRWVIESRTKAGTFYEVAQITATAWSCTCPAGQNGRCCWHVRQCQDELRQLRANLAAGVQVVDDGGRREPAHCGGCSQYRNWRRYGGRRLSQAERLPCTCGTAPQESEPAPKLTYDDIYGTDGDGSRGVACIGRLLA